eukprot:SAG11_NODE_2381_length_3426_cov_2.697507_2_plen_42_part_00
MFPGTKYLVPRYLEVTLHVLLVSPRCTILNLIAVLNLDPDL